MRVVYLINLKFKDCFLIDASSDIHIDIHRYHLQLSNQLYFEDQAQTHVVILRR